MSNPNEFPSYRWHSTGKSAEGSDRPVSPAYPGSPLPGKVYRKGRRRLPRWVLVGLAAVVGALGLGVCAGLTAGEVEDPSVVPAASSDAPSSSVAPTPTATVAAPEATPVGNGTYLVGEDIPAGSYRTEGSNGEVLDICTWSVTPPGGGIGDIGASEGQQRVTLRDGDLFTTEGCHPWNLDS